MKTVFISFSSKEDFEANRICKLLEDNGVSCFISSRDILPGKEYAEQLVDHISEAKVIVLLLSKASNDSPHVLREVEYAVSHKIPIIVYKLEEVTLSKSMEYFLMTHQWIADSDHKDQQLLDGVLKLINGIPESTSAPLPGTPRKRKRPVILCAAALTVALLAGIGIAFAGYGKTASTASKNSYEVGDTVTFGSYYGNPIEWRILKINDDNTMVLLSKYILSMKSFDAPEGGVYNEYDGKEYWSYENYLVTDEDIAIKIRGNNDWGVSNIRTWLNSDAEVVKYEDQAPTYKAVGENYYNSEPGFLYEFSEEEKDALVAVTNKSPANTFSRNAADGYVTSVDYVYLLSSDELSWIEDAGMPIYAKPTEACEEHDNYRATYDDFSEHCNTESYYWWLRDNSGEEISQVYLAVTEYENDMRVAPVNCGASNYGVRPVITVDATSESINKAAE